MFGADYAKGRMITGVSLSHSRGLGNYAGVDSGRLTSAVTGLYPWIGYKTSERVTVWTVAGYGAGGLMLSPGAGAPIETGLSMAMAAGGGRGQIIGGDEGFGLAFKADALWVGTQTKAATGPNGNSWNLTGLPDPRVITIPQGDLTATLGPLRKLDNDEKDGVTKVGFLLKKNRDEPWKLHNSGQSIYVDDDETPESERRRDRTTPAIFSGDNNAEEGTASFGFGVSIHPDPAPGQTITVD